MNFKLGTPMQYDDPHHGHARWSPNWRFSVAVRVTTSRRRSTLRPHYMLHSYFTRCLLLYLKNI